MYRPSDIRRIGMSKKIVVVNAGPRKGWNTDTLLTEAAKGAQSAGADVERFDLLNSINTPDASRASAVRGRSLRDAAFAGTALHLFWTR